MQLVFEIAFTFLILGTSLALIQNKFYQDQKILNSIKNKESTDIECKKIQKLNFKIIKCNEKIYFE